MHETLFLILQHLFHESILFSHDARFYFSFESSQFYFRLRPTIEAKSSLIRNGGATFN